jgi:hypothetical protein
LLFSSPPSHTFTSSPDDFEEQSDATMVEGHVAVICLAVAALALTAAALGIVGEATKSKAITRARTHPSSSTRACRARRE